MTEIAALKQSQAWNNNQIDLVDPAIHESIQKLEKIDQLEISRYVNL